MLKLKDLLKENKQHLNEGFSRQHYEAIAKIIKDTTGDGTKEHLCDEFIKLFKKDNSRFEEARFREACGVKLKNLIKEELDDMDVSLPSQVERFLDRAVRALKGYNLNKRKEQYVIAKLIDALGMTPSELMQSVQKLKKNKIVKR